MKDGRGAKQALNWIPLKEHARSINQASVGMTTLLKTVRILESNGKRHFS